MNRDAMDPGTTTAGCQAGPLAGLRVLDFSSSPAGAQASQTLADFGAEVAHVEPPGGSPVRSMPGYPFIARGKKSIVLDLGADEDLAVARSLARGADIVIETFRPGVMERFGLGYDDLRPDNPGLIFGSVTGFGRTGPYAAAKGYEALVLARIGALSASGGMVTRTGPAHVSVPLASGECNYTKFEFQPILHAQALDIISSTRVRDGSENSAWRISTTRSKASGSGSKRRWIVMVDAGRREENSVWLLCRRRTTPARSP